MKKKSDTFRDFVAEQLGEGVEIRAMFGGYGLYRGDAFFGIVFKGRLFFRTSPKTRRDYLDRGMKPFKPGARMTLKTYFEVPADVLEDREQVRAWADKASQRDADRSPGPRPLPRRDRRRTRNRRGIA